MNYIEAELRRQAEAFASLLNGGSRREKDAEEKAGERGDAAAGGGDGALRARFRFGESVLRRSGSEETAAWKRAISRRMEDGFRQEAEAARLTKTGLEAFAARRRRLDLERMEAERPAGWDEGRSVRAQRTGGAGEPGRTEGLTGGGAEPWEGSAGMILAVDGGLSAGELSRTFQRDARRYDGGYPLY